MVPRLNPPESWLLLAPVHGLAEWSDFYVIIGTSAGALTGLMFVVIALRSDAASRGSLETIEAYATPTVVHFATVVFLSGLLTVPEHTELSLGLLLAAAGLAGLGYTGWVSLQAKRTPDYSDYISDWVWRSLVPASGYAAALVAAVLVPLDSDAALYVVAGTALVFLFDGIHNAWDSAIWIASDHS